MSDLPKLRQEHDDLIEIAGRLSAAIAAPCPPAADGLLRLRQEFSFCLIGHLKGEDWCLYPRLCSSPDPYVAQIAREFALEMGGLAEAYVDYVEKWPANAIDADWRGYCDDTRAIIRAITIRITREERELYPLMERVLKRAA